MKLNHTLKTNISKKKYLSVLPFAILGSTAFVANQAQANNQFHCNDKVEETDSVSLTCTASGTNSSDKIVFKTDKKIVNFVIDDDTPYVATDKAFEFINFTKTYSTTDASEVGTTNIDLKKANITINTPGANAYLANINNNYDSTAGNSNLTLNLGKDFKISSSAESYGTVRGVHATTGGKLANNFNLTVDSTIKINTLNYSRGYATAIDASLMSGVDHEMHVVVNPNTYLETKSVQQSRGLNLSTNKKGHDDVVGKTYFTMNGGEIKSFAASAIGILSDGFYNDNFANSSNTKFYGELKAGSIYANNIVSESIRNWGSNDNKQEAIGIYLNNQEVNLNQYKDNTINVSGNNSFGIKTTSKNVNLNLAGTINSEETAIGIIEDPTLALGTTTAIINIQDGTKILTGNVGNKGYILKDSEGVSNTTVGKAKIRGSFSLAGGNDNLTFNSTNLKDLGSINGGSGFDKVTFANYDHEATLDADQLENLERINLAHSTLNLNGDELEVGHGTVDSNEGGLFLDHATLKINSNDSRYHNERNFNLVGDLHNQADSTLDLRNDSNPEYFNTLTINGDYYGGGTVVFNSKAGNDQSQADKLVINGNVHGETKVVVNNKDGLGDATVDGIKLIELTDNSVVDSTDAFKLANNVEAGLYEYNALAYSDTNGKKGFYLKSETTNGGTGGTGTNQRGDSSTIDVTGSNKLFRQDVVGYLLAQQIHNNALANVNSTLHQRASEQRAETNYLNRDQSWVRVLTNQSSLDVANLGAKSGEYAIQVGYDLNATHEGALRSRYGISASYNKVESKLSDSNRKELNLPGRVDSDLATLGGYYTTYLGNNYLDLVGGLHFINADYEVKHGGNQKAYGGSLSLEAGSNLDLGNNFFVEPQVQLSYQGTHYSAFKDTVSDIKAYNSQSLRPRLGLRLGYHDVKGTNLWVHANLEFELLKTAKLQIGNTLVATDRAAKKVYDLGLNGQVALSPTTVLYGSAQYKASFGKGKDGKAQANKFHGYGAEVGLRFTW